jgi:hypothetical protein
VSRRSATSGALAARLGVPATFVANGLATLVASLAFLRTLPALRCAVRSRDRELGLVVDRGD